MPTEIEWTRGDDGSKGETWNPLVGCEYASPGCEGCYAAREAFGRLKVHPLYAGLAHRVEGHDLPRFTGEVRLVPDRLDQPLRWRRPRRVFVNSMSDLFHPDVPVGFICDVFVRMGLANQHQFQVLTKRPQRMASVLSDAAFREEWFYARERRAVEPDVQRLFDSGAVSSAAAWPLPNVWLGTSVESQRYADLRIPHLLKTPAAVRFLSVEPLLGPVDLRAYLADPDDTGEGWAYRCQDHGMLDCTQTLACRGVQWVIVGGESGPGARPMHPDWVRSLRDQCVAAGVPVFFKQWGEWRPAREYTDGTLLIQVADGRTVTRAEATAQDPYGTGTGPQDLVDRGHPGWARVVRVGKKAAGRDLDGRTWDEYPSVTV